MAQMNDQSKQAPCKAASLGLPSPTQDGNVLIPPMMPMPQGTLCKASGTIAPDPGFRVMQVLVKVVKDPNATVPTGTNVEKMQWMMSPPVATYIPNPIPNFGDAVNWVINSDPNLQATTTPTTPAGPNNKIFSAGILFDTGLGAKLSGISDAAFKGVAVSSCPASFEAADAAAQPCSERLSILSLANSGAAPVHGHHGSRHHNSDCCHRHQRDWFDFDALAVDSFNGSWLHLHGRPLKARTIAVAARNVAWKPSPQSSLVIRRSHAWAVDYNHPGTLPNIFPFRFPGLPAHSIVIYQPGSGLAHAVNSDCIDHPDVVSLDPSQDVWVLVNDRSLDYADNTGSFSLSVAILDAQ